MSTKTNTLPEPPRRHRPVTCTALGCAEESNGIGPYQKCPAHFARYQTRLARHDHISDVVARSLEVEQVSRAVVELLTHSPIALKVAAAEDWHWNRDELPGIVMDVLCAGMAHAGDTRVSSRAASAAYRHLQSQMLPGDESRDTYGGRAA